jgi:hypothetical protein
MYIYWIHNSNPNTFSIKNKLFGLNKNVKNGNIKHIKPVSDDDIDEKLDELSFLKSNSDVSVITKDDLGNFDE